jgi:iron complex transport system substrate-binding protein
VLTPSPATFSLSDLEIARMLGADSSRLRTSRRVPRPLAASTADLWRDVRRVSDALGVPERGVQFITRCRHRLLAISGRAATRPRRRVALLLGGGAPVPSWRAELLDFAAADDALAGSASVSLAALAAADPDAIVVAPSGADLARARDSTAARAESRIWRALRAVREGCVFFADGRTSFARPDAHVAETLEVLAEALHPEAFRFGHRGTLWQLWDA